MRAPTCVICAGLDNRIPPNGGGHLRTSGYGRSTAVRSAVSAALLLLSSAGAAAGAQLPAVCDAGFWKFEQVLGTGTGGADPAAGECVIRLESNTPEGMAASWKSAEFAVEPNRRYIVSMEIRTRALEPVTARLTGQPYILFRDAKDMQGGYQPVAGALAPRDAGWTRIERTFTVPTTARHAELHLAFGAYGGYEKGHYPRESGRARGTLWIRNVQWREADRVEVPPSTLRVAEPAIEDALQTVAACLHNASLGGVFTVSDGYTLSGNIVPDLTFGLFGVRRLAYPRYMEMFERYWRKIGGEFTLEGRTSQRVMAQVLFPLGVDEIYSFTGDNAFLGDMLPIVDRSFDYLKARADKDGLVRLVEYGQWRIGQGADWVDWYKTRMEGKTFNFHQWYWRALVRFAELHRELAAKSDRAAAAEHRQRSSEYAERARLIESSLRRLYWKDSYFVTNIDYGGMVADERWMDDQLWAIRLGIATPEMTRKIWSWIDAKPDYFEGVPTRWAGFEGPAHGADSWFGRLGAGDILARYRRGDPGRAYELLLRMSRIFARDGNVYEAYDMKGEPVRGTLGFGNYTEHSGGYIWAVAEGLFGIDFDSDAEAVATIRPHIPAGRQSASAAFYLRGTRIGLRFNGTTRRLTLSAHGPVQRIRLYTGTKSQLVTAGDGYNRQFQYEPVTL